jgi:hypothetical protein
LSLGAARFIRERVSAGAGGASIDEVLSGPPVNPSLEGCGQNIPVLHAPDNTSSIETPPIGRAVHE